jgi:DNA polymerase V
MYFMEDFFSEPVYQGTKRFTQLHVPTANATGFGAAADDYAERGIDLNEQLILNKAATFFFRMNSDAMTGASISMGDVLIVDRSIKAENGRIVVVANKGELLVRYIHYFSDRIALIPASDNHKIIEVRTDTENDCKAWGVVTCVIHILETRLMVINRKE